jgi:hypothetical protein
MEPGLQQPLISQNSAPNLSRKRSSIGADFFGRCARNGWRLLVALVMAALLAASWPCTAAAQQESVTDLQINNTRDDLLVYFKLKGAFSDNINEVIYSGVPVTFTYIANVYKVQNFWMDSKIAAVKITHTLEYDNLKKEFSVHRSWQGNDPLLTRSFEEAQRNMTVVSSLRVLSLDQLEKGNRYQIRVKAELSKVTLPFYLHYILFFVSLWDVETAWQTVDFIF